MENNKTKKSKKKFVILLGVIISIIMFAVGTATQKGDKVDDIYAAGLGVGVIIIIIGCCMKSQKKLDKEGTESNNVTNIERKTINSSSVEINSIKAKEYNFDTLDYGKARIIIKNNSVTISRSGPMAKIKYGHTGERTFMIDQISAVELKEAGIIMGHIQFIVAGTSAKSQPLFASQKERADDNTVMFSNKALNASAREIKEYIEQYKSGNNLNVNTQKSSIGEIKELKELLDMGAITQEEFEKKKKELLNL